MVSDDLKADSDAEQGTQNAQPQMKCYRIAQKESVMREGQRAQLTLIPHCCPPPECRRRECLRWHHTPAPFPAPTPKRLKEVTTQMILWDARQVDKRLSIYMADAQNACDLFRHVCSRYLP